MYYVHIKDLVIDDPFPMYQNISELIEADGEAEELFLNQTVDDQCPTQYFTAIDWVSGDDIELDIADYINQNTYDLFEKCIYNTPEDKVFSFIKADSYLKACIAYTSRRR